MSVLVVWRTELKKGNEEEGLSITQKIWEDMKKFNGYLSHEILLHEDDKGHILVVGEWTDREVADRIKTEYADSENVKLITPLLRSPRQRWVFDKVD